jgi:TonB family protein
MSNVLVWSNILAWSLQAGLVVGIGALAPEMLKLRIPRARLLYWQVLLVACLSLPWIRGWRQEVVTGAIQVSSVITAAAEVSAPVRRVIPFPQIALWVLEAGIALRLLCLVVGIVRLGAYRRRGTTIASAAGSGVILLLSDDVSSPVTFGWRDPVVLLPANFEELPETMQDAILCHELLHVERRDWLFTLAEEVVRAVLWFHPAIWWVIGEIQLAREQTVDQAVIETTRARGPYVDALLLMAGASLEGASGQLELASAPGFLRRRHLKRRLMEVVKEVRMATISKTRLVCAMAAAVAMVAGVCWLATGAFPLLAAPQVVNDAAGVAVNMNGSQLMHRTPVAYPPDALARGVEGTVVVQVKLDANAEVSDATVLSGPDELRKAVLQSVLSWHFDRSAASTTRTVNIDFVKPAATVPGGLAVPAQVVTPFGPGQPFAVGGRGGRGGSGRMMAPPAPPPPPASAKLDHIEVVGLSDTARSQLLASLPVQEGAEWNSQTFAAVRDAASKFDSHLTVGVIRSANGALTLHIGLANSDAVPVTYRTASAAPDVAPPAPADLPGGVYSVGNGTLPPMVLTKVDPVFPADEPAGFAGSVMLSIVVGTDGKAEDIRIVKSLGADFDANAISALQQWVFKPGTNHGVPVNVKAQIEVNVRKL